MDVKVTPKGKRFTGFTWFLLLTLLFFSRNIFFGRTYTPLSVISHWTYESGEYGISYQKDALLIHLSNDWRYSTLLKKGKLFRWSPYAFSGYPVYANGHSAFHNPLKMMFNLLFPPLTAREVLLFVHLFLCGYAFFLFLLEGLNSGFIPSLFGGTAWAFSGHIISLMEWEWSVMAGSYLPLLCLFFIKWIKTGKKVYITGSVIIVYLLYTCGNMQWTLYGLLLFTSLFLYEGIIAYKSSAKSGLRILTYGTVVVVTGTLLSSVELLPTLEFFSLSSTTRPEAGISTLKVNLLMQFRLILSLFHPQIIGSPFNQVNLWPPDIKSFYFFNPYIGVISLATFISGLTLGWNKKYAKFLFIIFILTLLVALGTPITKLLIYLPIVGKFYHERILFITVFCMSALSAFGMEEMLRDEKRKIKYITLALVVILNASALFAGIALLHDYTVTSWFSLKNPVFVKIVLLIVGTMILYISLIILKDKGKVACVALIWLTLDLIPLGMMANTCDSREKLQVLEEIKKALPEDTFNYRIAGLEPNLPTLLGFYSIEGYDSLYPDILFRIFFPNPSSWIPRWILYASSEHLPLMRLLGVRFLFTNGRLNAENPFAEIIGKGEARFYKKVGNLNIYELRNPFPRVFIPQSVKIMTESEFVEKIYSDSSFLSPDILVLSRPPLQTSSGNGRARLIKYEPEEVKIEVEMEDDGFLVLTDTFYPGWKAYIDGEETEIFKAYHFLRAVHIKKGKHLVEFRFNPFSYRAGGVLTILTLIGIIIWTAIK